MDSLAGTVVVAQAVVQPRHVSTGSPGSAALVRVRAHRVRAVRTGRGRRRVLPHHVASRDTREARCRSSAGLERADALVQVGAVRDTSDSLGAAVCIERLDQVGLHHDGERRLGRCAGGVGAVKRRTSRPAK